MVCTSDLVQADISPITILPIWQSPSKSEDIVRLYTTWPSLGPLPDSTSKNDLVSIATKCTLMKHAHTWLHSLWGHSECCRVHTHSCCLWLCYTKWNVNEQTRERVVKWHILEAEPLYVNTRSGLTASTISRGTHARYLWQSHSITVSVTLLTLTARRITNEWQKIFWKPNPRR